MRTPACPGRTRGDGRLTRADNNSATFAPEIQKLVHLQELRLSRNQLRPTGEGYAHAMCVCEFSKLARADRVDVAEAEERRRLDLEGVGAADGERNPETLNADVRFHRLMLAASRNALLSGLGACIENALRASISITSDPRVSDPIALDQHRLVLDAIVALRSALLCLV